MENMLIKSISKPKLPKGYAYILQSSQLNKLLSENHFSIHTDLIYWTPQVLGSIFEVHYWLPNENVQYTRLYIRAGALKSNDANMAKEAMINIVLPQFAIWLDKILKLPDNSPILNETPYFNAVFKENKIEISS